ncbi:hypothetical protein [Dyadobacter sp. MSC1_007]|jgi:hypothetical protein|uniref:hypothetical protein n=1 Tax=Dyadobacter sp. MSC1_007 TaxID=2909264 RepID=UPI00203015DD|nr:hypothetical protein [Dyadobacter sp. MSC1_007]
MKKNLLHLWLLVLLTAVSWSCDNDDHEIPDSYKLEDSWKPGWNSQKVLDMAKGQRPDPSVYLDEKYITYHLGKFAGGAAYLVTKKALDDYGRDTLGYPDNTQFVMTKTEMDAMLVKTNKDISKIEKELGIPADSWKGKPMVIIQIPNPKELNVRVPSGNEMGANNLWLPGGELPTGYSEAVVNKIPKGKYIETPL